MRQLVLIESGRRQSKSTPATGMMSAALHGVLVLLAVLATEQSTRGLREPRSETRVHFASPRPTRTPQAPPATAERSQEKQATASPRLPELTWRPPVSIEIPNVLPPLGTSLHDPSVAAELAEHLTTGAGGARPHGLGSPTSGGAYLREEVDVPAAFLADQSGPRYPELLLRERIAGRVRVRFVVGVKGRADHAPEFVFATRPEFAASVRDFLATARYRPARIGGKPVPQLVEQEFVFALN